MINAVIFDMDGVIFDSERMVIKCWETVAEKYGLPNIYDHCIEATGMNVAETKKVFIRRYGEDVPYDEYRAERKKLFEEAFYNDEVAVKKGTFELLNYLHDNGFKIALATSTSEATVRKELEFKGLIDYFDVIVCGDMVENSKPAPDIFLLAAEKLGVDPSHAVGIEDSFNGVRASKGAGLYTIMVPDIKEPDDEMKGLSDVILPDLIEVRNHIDSLVQAETKEIEGSFKLGPFQTLYLGASLFALIVLTLVMNNTEKLDINWIRFVIGGQLLSGIGLIMSYNANTSKKSTQDKYSGLFFVGAGIIVIIFTIVKRFFL